MVLGTLLASCSQAPDPEGFRRLPIEPALYSLFDLGVTDIDGDARLDIFTVNHSSPQSLLLNRGEDGFEDVFRRTGPHQDPRFPGLTSTGQAPTPTDPGLYVYWVGPRMTLQAHALAEPLEGTVRLDSPVRISRRTSASAAVTTDGGPPESARSTVTFRLEPGGSVVLEPHIHALPIEVEVDDFDPEHIFVGPSAVSPPAARFDAFLKDRHGAVWFDYDSDGDTDLFFTRGGQKGWMKHRDVAHFDELHRGGGQGFRAVGDGAGLAKDGCPGRQAGAVDYDSDGGLDLYVVCGRPGETHPNRLFRRVDEHRFADVAADAGLDIGDDGAFAWVDVDRDGDMDLVWDGAAHGALYRNDGGRFVRLLFQQGLRKTAHKHLSVADYDGDGDLDLFSACFCGNLLLRNDDGRLVQIDPTRHGLPQASQTANWVDYDNDGDADLHAVPDGLYAQSEGAFEATGILAARSGTFDPRTVTGGAATWFDLDNDGARDVIYVLQRTHKHRRWVDWLDRIGGLDGPATVTEAVLLRNRRTDNHWLQVVLVGGPGNRQAVGSRVEIEYPGGMQVQQVGAAEGSQFSAGHYRVYFGLGAARRIERLRIHWPDGGYSEPAVPAADQVVVVNRNGVVGRR